MCSIKSRPRVAKVFQDVGHDDQLEAPASKVVRAEILNALANGLVVIRVCGLQGLRRLVYSDEV